MYFLILYENGLSFVRKTKFQQVIKVCIYFDC